MLGRLSKLFRNLLGAPNPTQGWTRDETRALVLDLDASSLSGVALGAAFTDLAFLGPAHRSKPDAERWEFRPLGVAAEVEDTRISAFYVVPIPDEYFEVEPYAGVVVIGGARVPIAWISREREARRAFGEPTRRDQDDDETILFYEAGRVERQIELTPEGRIKTIAIFSYP